MKEAILQFKFHYKTKLGKPLVQWLISRIPGNIDIQKYQVILPVPLHKTRQKQRGYNQSAILARHLARHYQLHLILRNLIRIRPTDAQSQIKGRKERQENVKNAFRLRFPGAIRDRNLILVDDVLTTGATVNECAKTLKQAGATSILVLTLSRVGFQYKPDPM
jgi:ComF family protein